MEEGQKFTVIIGKAGDTVKVKGIKGKGCTALTGDIEKKLGTVTNVATTSEYCEEVENEVTNYRNRS